MTEDEAADIEPFLTNNNFLIGFIYSFNMGLGNFMIDYKGLKDEALLWILFYAEVMLI
jgi:hypothetical protein